MSTDDSEPARPVAERVRAFLRGRTVSREDIVTFEQSTKTAQMAADAVGCELGQIVKSLVFVVDGRRRWRSSQATAEETARRSRALVRDEGARSPTPDTVRAATGYAIGGVSPFDLPDGLPVLIDDSLARFEYGVRRCRDAVVDGTHVPLDELVALSVGVWHASRTRPDMRS